MIKKKSPAIFSWVLVLGITLNSFIESVHAIGKIKSVSTPVGTASNLPVTFFIPFEGYTGGRPTEVIISDVESRGDLNSVTEYIDLRVRKIVKKYSFIHITPNEPSCSTIIIFHERSQILLFLPHTQ